ncbi:hypothetical protein [uncultured Limosilactobacillus sp.]|uniref:hypothetical protein n=1 Tax=uncultured Limosilactobacillus sp. TaxID=2837629 RepID=UPI0025ED4922|nr:hypothetical protein [uncultured Limosilactobacillus sp.]
MGGVNLQPSDKQTAGLVWLNGAKNKQATWYRITQLGGGFKIVELAVDFTGVSANAWQGKDVLKIPDTIAMHDGGMEVAQGAHYLNLVGNTVSVTSGDTNGLTADSSTWGRFVYITN